MAETRTSKHLTEADQIPPREDLVLLTEGCRTPSVNKVDQINTAPAKHHREDRVTHLVTKPELTAADVIGLLDMGLGDNGLTLVTKTGISASSQLSISETTADGLLVQEQQTLLEFEREVQLNFPCSPLQLVEWYERNRHCVYLGPNHLIDKFALRVRAAAAKVGVVRDTVEFVSRRDDPPARASDGVRENSRKAAMKRHDPTRRAKQKARDLFSQLVSAGKFTTKTAAAEEIAASILGEFPGLLTPDNAVRTVSENWLPKIRDLPNNKDSRSFSA